MRQRARERAPPRLGVRLVCAVLLGSLQLAATSSDATTGAKQAHLAAKPGQNGPGTDSPLPVQGRSQRVTAGSPPDGQGQAHPIYTSSRPSTLLGALLTAIAAVLLAAAVAVAAHTQRLRRAPPQECAAPPLGEPLASIAEEEDEGGRDALVEAEGEPALLSTGSASSAAASLDRSIGKSPFYFAAAAAPASSGSSNGSGRLLPGGRRLAQSDSEGRMQPRTPALRLSARPSAEQPWQLPVPASPFAAQSRELQPLSEDGAIRPLFLPTDSDDSSSEGRRPGTPGAGSWAQQRERRPDPEPRRDAASSPERDSASDPEQERERDSSAVLQELVQHRAAQDSEETSSGDSGLDAVAPQLVLASLPASLREWVVPCERIRYLRKPDGSLQMLGEGASGRVVKAVYNGEVVAAKELDIGRSLDSQKSFVSEAVRLVLLRHANVISFYGCSLDGPRGILLTEFCEGRDLHSVLQLQAFGTQERLFGWHRRGRRVALEVAKALNYLHSKNIVHMDIKSCNVLLSASGTAKLADVGLSRLQTRTVMSDLSLVGTFAWAAPEILMGGISCTRAVDLYSFGVLLYEIVTGERPVRGHLRMPLVPDECPQDVLDLMFQCLSTDSLVRPSAQQLMQRLAGMVEAPGGPARTPSCKRRTSLQIPCSREPSEPRRASLHLPTSPL